ncbi:MAG: hypothetical protein JWL70_1530 [Acidimicrobiia bacterium]|nr:hypothetical protein [Acidimicrobiia bacterium]
MVAVSFSCEDVDDGGQVFVWRCTKCSAHGSSPIKRVTVVAAVEHFTLRACAKDVPSGPQSEPADRVPNDAR